MIEKTFETREEWLEARRGKITGSRLKDVITLRGTGKKIGFYELIAERLSVPADGEDPMERGTRLEEEALQKFQEISGKKVKNELVLWERDDEGSIALSPDGTIGKKEAVEVKCLSSARHIEAFLTQKVPSEYEMQVLQYFIVNEKIETLYFVFYDPRVLVKPLFYLTIKREDVAGDIEQYLEYQRAILKEVEEAVLQLSF